MRSTLTFMLILLLGGAVSLQAAVVGEPSPLVDGSVDGWSGVTVLNGYGGLPAGELVETVNFYANPGRADGSHHAQWLIAKEEGGTFTVWDVGPVATPTEGGEHSMSWGSSIVPDDGNTYHPAFWQWNEGVDDVAGGVVPFANSGGSGMFQHNEPGTSYVPEVGDEITMQHASGPGGRAYQFNYVTAVPEPSTAMLLLLGVLPIVRLVCRKK